MAKTEAEQTPTSLKWYQERRWAAALVPVCLLGFYIMASLALNSASFIEYGVAILFLILAINRTAHVIIVSVTGKPHNG